MPELAAPDYQVARFLLERGLAAIYLVAFVVAWRQFPALCGERGLEPAPRFLRLVPRFLDAPTVFRWVGYSDAKLRALSGVGIAISAALLLGLPQAAPLPITMLAWFVLWVGYQSVVNIGGSFYSFGWETLLLEAGFLAIFLGNAAIAPPILALFAFRWLAFRVEFGAGLIKLRGDRCWRELRCMDYHHETQPMPNPLSWLFHRLPARLHRAEVLGNFAAQLVLPFGLFLPQPFATVAAILMIATQLYLVVSGNYAWLNWATIVVMTAAIGDGVLEAIARLVNPAFSLAAPAFEATPAWFTGIVLLLALVIVALSWFPVRNLLSPNQAMNASFDPFRLVNTYGAFGSVSRNRDEVIVEGTDATAIEAGTAWREYEFKGKPGDVRRLPPQFAPYHLRLDWLMWFLPLSSRYGERWFVPFLVKLLEGDRPTLALLRSNPFPDRPPRFVRARLYRYRFTTVKERRETGAWWARTLIGEYVPPVTLRDGARARPRAGGRPRGRGGHVSEIRDSGLDAVIVGGGPNGLAAAITLAREGHAVQVVERAAEVGGGSRSAELTLPDFVHDVCSATHPFGRTSPFFVETDLERFGLRWIESPASLAHPLDDGRAVLVTRDVDATARQLGADRDAYRRLIGPIVRGFDSLIPDMLAPFHIPLRPRRALSLAWFGLNALQPATWVARRFGDDAARALFAGVAAHSILRLDEPFSSAAAIGLLAAAHHDGWPFPAGGAGEIAKAMAAALEDLGGSIETERPVEHLEDLPRSRLALFDTSPGALARVAAGRLPRAYREKLRNVRYGPSVYKVDVALDGPIPWQNEDVARAATVHLGGTFEEIEASEAAAARGELHPKPFVLLAQHSLFDRSRAPAGKHTAWAYCHVPHASTADASETILGQIERYAPGFRERILAVTKTTPAELEAFNPNDVGGDISGGRLDLRQLFTRPVARVDPYSTPDPRLFLCSSSTPPGGGVHGMCGWHAAHSALRRLDARHD